MEDNDSIDPMFDNDFSPEALEQLDAIYQVAAKYLFATKDEFEREFVGMHPDELGEVIESWQTLTDAFLLYRKRHVEGQKLAGSKAELIVSALIGLMTIPPNADADEIDEALIDFDELPEHVRHQVMSCLLKVSDDSTGGQENEQPDRTEAIADHMWADLQLGMFESVRSPGGHDSGRRKKRTKQARRK